MLKSSTCSLCKSTGIWTYYNFKQGLCDNCLAKGHRRKKEAIS